MEKMIKSILCDDLRNALINLGTLEENNVSGEKEKQIDTLLDALEKQYDQYRTTVEVSFKNLKEEFEKMQEKQDKQGDKLQQLYAKVTNGLDDRLRCLEEENTRIPQQYIPRQEFNGAIRSLRDALTSNNKTLSLIATIIITLNVGILGSFVTLLIMRGG